MVPGRGAAGAKIFLESWNHQEETPKIIQSNHRSSTVTVISSSPLTASTAEENSPHLTVPSFQAGVQSDEVSPEPPPGQTNASPSATPHKMYFISLSGAFLPSSGHTLISTHPFLKRAIPVPEGNLDEKWRGTLQEQVVTGQGEWLQTESRFGRDIRKKFFTVKMLRDWQRFLREAVDVPFLPVFKATLDEALSSLV
ncbi:hypothetical protein DUI87_09738 [Hirundo rustica rustica]|uniref:Uncharacterized protein n=1 Tax=Hirundo rustica rustica TaxID=333673 RepID=A0A3M0KYM8_HIRRU|nr:hypothetical protein DUI87_09738 [Hirundo rustica rustica]